MNETPTPVLIVDDEESVREVLSRTLTQASYRCVTAPSAEEALFQLDQEAFALALLDLRMPGMSGVDLLRLIKKKRPETAIIMITAVNETEQAVEVMRLGANDYLLKPFALEKVHQSVEQALAERHRLLARREYQLHLEQEVSEQAERIRETFLGSIEALIRAMETKDPYTRGHTERVTTLACMAARAMGLGQGEVEQLRLGALVHDIGKIGIKEEILLKPGKLTPVEYAHIITHPTLGEYILRSVMEDPQALGIVHAHHERFDGNGYPQGLRGTDIPLGARIVAVVDAFDAMTSDRAYRRALSREKARRELLRCAGTQFDPKVVEIFLRALGRNAASGISSDKEAPPRAAR